MYMEISKSKQFTFIIIKATEQWKYWVTINPTDIQQLKALAAIADDLGSISSTLTLAHNHL